MQNAWWRGGVIYQIYPRSYQDSNADGCGDLAGITQRLPYIARLGVDAIWISPFFKSPMKDFGYDIQDYCDIAPLFGNMSDFESLIYRAHELNLKVMIDLVISHTSDQHEWFRQSRASCDNPKSDWYVWADAKPDGTPPNNWLSIFGGSAWQWDSRRCQYYLHNFLSTQPDLNFHHSEVQDAVLRVADFWLQKGVDGFRLDTINFYFHDLLLRDNPPLPPSLRNDSIAPAVNPYNHQEHLYDRNRPENIPFLERLRALMDQYPDRAAVGEVGDALKGLDIMAEYTEGDKRMHMCYAFDFLSPEPLSAEKVQHTLSRFTQSAPDSWACWAFSNHDVVRHATRLRRPEGDAREQAKLHAAILLSLNGSICLYQGEELGLTEAQISYEDLQDPYGKEFWPEFKGRDGCRTPMVWDSHARHTGFSEANTTWLPIDRSHPHQAVNLQEADPNSVLQAYRALIQLRRSHKALRQGRIEFCHCDQDELLVFRRSSDKETLVCVFNFGNSCQAWPLPEGFSAQLNVACFSSIIQEQHLQIPRYGAAWVRIEEMQCVS